MDVEVPWSEQGAIEMEIVTGPVSKISGVYTTDDTIA